MTDLLKIIRFGCLGGSNTVCRGGVAKSTPFSRISTGKASLEKRGMGELIKQVSTGTEQQRIWNFNNI